MLKDIIKAEHVGGYKIRFTFEDGRSGIYDFGNKFEKKGVFKKLKSKEYFRRFYINKELGTICWPDGEDIAPETIYKNIAA